MDGRETLAERVNPRRITLVGGALLGATILTRSLATICAKLAAESTKLGSIMDVLTNGWYHAEVACLGLQAVFWVATLRRMALSSAYPFLSLSLVISFLAATQFFNEPASSGQFIGVTVIVAGVVIGTGGTREAVE